MIRTLSNQGFLAKATPEVVAKKNEQRDELELTIQQLKSQIADLA